MFILSISFVIQLLCQLLQNLYPNIPKSAQPFGRAEKLNEWIWLSKLEMWKHVPSTFPVIQLVTKSFRWYFLKSTHICHLLSTLTAITLVLVQATSILYIDYYYSSLTTPGVYLRAQQLE